LKENGVQNRARTRSLEQMSMAGKKITIGLPGLALIGMTRGFLGAGVGFLASGLLEPRARRAVGLALLAVGVLTTIPIALQIRSELR
jgi:hypothetical protein